MWHGKMSALPVSGAPGSKTVGLAFSPIPEVFRGELVFVGVAESRTKLPDSGWLMEVLAKAKIRGDKSGCAMQSMKFVET